jgi:hypothetical protein
MTLYSHYFDFEHDFVVTSEVDKARIVHSIAISGYILEYTISHYFEVSA